MQIPRLSRPAGSRGFTLIELIIAVFVLALALGFGVPAFQNSIANSNMRGTTMDLITAVNTARAEAVSQRKPIQLKAVAGGWSDGWLLDYDKDEADGTQTEDLQSFETRGSVTVAKSDNNDAINFQANGMVYDVGKGAISDVTFTVCDGRDDERGRTITVNRFGKLENVTHADGSICNP